VVAGSKNISERSGDPDHYRDVSGQAGPSNPDRNPIMLKKILLATAMCGLTLGLISTTFGTDSEAHAFAGPVQEIQLNDIMTPLVPTELLGGDREFGGNGPNIHSRVKLKISGDRRSIIAEVYFHAKETKSDWSETRGTWNRTVFTAPAGKKIDRIVGSTMSEVRFMSQAGGFQILGPGEDFVKFVQQLAQLVNQLLDAERTLANRTGDTPEVRDARNVIRMLETGAASLTFDGNHVHPVNPKVAGPVHLFAIVGDTGGDDISKDTNPKDDTRIQAIKFNKIRIQYQ
jgi:hypothetical protein